MSSIATSGALADQKWKGIYAHRRPSSTGPAVYSPQNPDVGRPSICKIRKMNIAYLTHQRLTQLNGRCLEAALFESTS